MAQLKTGSSVVCLYSLTKMIVLENHRDILSMSLQPKIGGKGTPS